MTNIKSVVVGLLLCLVTVSSVRAEITIDISKISCKDFLLPTFIVPDDIAYWLSGYYNGKRGNTVIDVAGLRDYVNKVEQYCLANNEMTVMKAAEAVINGAK